MTPAPIPTNPRVLISQPLLSRIERELSGIILDIEAVAKTQERPMQLALAMIRRTVYDVMERVTPYTGEDAPILALDKPGDPEAPVEPEPEPPESTQDGSG